MLISDVGQWVIAIPLPRISLIFFTSLPLTLLDAYATATYEYELGSPPAVSYFMASTPDDQSVILYSSDRRTVLDQQLRHNTSCSLNSSSLAVKTPLCIYCMF